MLRGPGGAERLSDAVALHAGACAQCDLARVARPVLWHGNFPRRDRSGKLYPLWSGTRVMSNSRTHVRN